MLNKSKIVNLNSLMFVMLTISLFNFCMLDNNIVLLFIVIIIQLYILETSRLTRWPKVMCLIYFEIIMIFINLKFIKFDFMPQAKVMLDTGETLVNYFLDNHPHAIRLLIAYPGYIISNLANIDLDYAYSYYILIIFCFFYINIFEIYLYIARFIDFYSYILVPVYIFISIMILSFIMNGRVIFAFLGFAIVLKNLIYVVKSKFYMKNYFGILAGVLLSTVSSGTMLVVIIFLILIIVYLYGFKIIYAIKLNQLKMLITLSLVTPVVVVLISYVNLMLMRNINYFGGGIFGLVNMMNHGIGRYFNDSKLGLFIFLIILTILVEFSHKLIKLKLKNSEFIFSIFFISIISCCIGFIFGHSAGSLIIVPFILGGLLCLFKERL